MTYIKSYVHNNIINIINMSKILSINWDKTILITYSNLMMTMSCMPTPSNPIAMTLEMILSTSD